jgi:WD40 repeat protein
MIKLDLRGKVFTADRHILINVSGTYFDGMLSSGAWLPNSDGVYVIDQPHEGFDRILDCLSTGELNCKGLSDYEIDCLYQNLDYFLIPFVRLWDYATVSRVKHIKLDRHFIQLKDDRLCGGAKFNYGIQSDYSILIRSMDVGAAETSLMGHARDISYITQLKDGRICSGSEDGAIKVWNINTSVCELSYLAHPPTGVKCILQLIDERLCSLGSWDSPTVKVWRLNTGVCDVSIYIGLFVAGITSLKDLRLCCRLEHSGEIEVWSVSTGVRDFALIGHASTVNAVVNIDESRICSCSDDRLIKIWNTSTGVCARTLEGHQDRVKDIVVLMDGRLCSLCTYGDVKIWNMDTGECVFSVNINVETKNLMRIIQLHDGRLLATDIYGNLFMVGA